MSSRSFITYGQILIVAKHLSAGTWETRVYKDSVALIRTCVTCYVLLIPLSKSKIRSTKSRPHTTPACASHIMTNVTYNPVSPSYNFHYRPFPLVNVALTAFCCPRMSISNIFTFKVKVRAKVAIHITISILHIGSTGLRKY